MNHEAGPSLTIVMPTRNQAEFLPAAVDSVLMQAEGLAADLELVVADGASTDGTQALLAELEARHPGRIRWCSEPDAGPADAVNKAVAQARGDIIGWLNSDDLYVRGAAARAMEAFAARPDLVMVYGEGNHVDLGGSDLGRYPTRPPDTPLSAWADGCWICQPTAFFRREAFVALGGLDRRLAAAFDYEFWLRLFKTYPGRVGHVDALQALSRLHAGGITLRMREQVAMEALEVVHRHIGAAPGHWLLTHVGEALSACPFDADAETVRRRLLELADRAAPWLAAGEPARLKQQMRGHRAWQIARTDLAADVYPDGWAPPELKLRLRQPSRPYRRLRLWGQHAAPLGGPLHLAARGLGAPGDDWRGGTSRPGPFEVSIPLPPTPGACLDITIVTLNSFVPAATVSGSSDTRSLAFQLAAAEPA